METGSIVKDLRDLLQDIVAPEVKALTAEMLAVHGESQSLRRDLDSPDERLFNAIERASRAELSIYKAKSVA